MRARATTVVLPIALAAVLVVAVAWFGPRADSSPAAAPASHNLTRLVADAAIIVVAKVVGVTDGVTPQGEPYTEVTLTVARCLKGGLRDGSRHSFRQAGLVAARRMPDGSVLRELRPPGYPSWQEGEEVIAFLQAPTRRTGLLSTVGLEQGKFTRLGGRAANVAGNRGLFAGVAIRPDLLTAEERALLASTGPIDAATFTNLVARAVRDRWIESGAMR
jgi:hypothetical protein